MQAQPLGPTFRVDGKESDIVEVIHTFSGLRIVVSTWTDSINETFLQVYFRRAHAYRYLEEVDLLEYWQTGVFRSAHHVYEITEGGWLNGEPILPSMFVSVRNTALREWFICTSNWSMTVLSAREPELADLKRWPANDAEQIVGREPR